MYAVAADLRDLFAGEVAKNKRLVHELERLQTQLFQSKQEVYEWKNKSEKMSYEADLCKREVAHCQNEITRLRNALDQQTAECRSLTEQLKEVRTKWRNDAEASGKKIDELRSISDTLTKTVNELERKLEAAERPPTELLKAVNTVRTAAEEEITSRLSTQEMYYQKRLELLASELEGYRKQYEEMRQKIKDAQWLADNLKPLNEPVALKLTERTSEVMSRQSGTLSVDLGGKQADRQSAGGAEDSESKPGDQSVSEAQYSADENQEEVENADTVCLLSPRPGSTLTHTSDVSTEFRKQLQQLSVRPRSSKLRKAEVDAALNVAMPLVARPMSAPHKQADDVAHGAAATSTSLKSGSYIGDGPDYLETLLAGRKVKFDNADDNENVGDVPMTQSFVSDSGSLNSTQCVARAVRISCVHPKGTYIRIQNVSDSAEEIGGHLLKQLVDGKEIIQYRFVQSVTLSGGSSLTIWASGDLNDETVERLNCSAEHIVWKDLRSWNAGEHCTTVFAKPSGEALSWVTGPLLDPVQRTSLSLERPNQVQRTDSLSTTNWRSDGREARRASRSYYSHLRTPRNSLEPQTCPVIKRQYSGKVRVDEFDCPGDVATQSSIRGRSRSANTLSVSNTSHLLMPNPFSSPRTLVAQGLEILKAQHNARFQPPMFNPRMPVASN